MGNYGLVQCNEGGIGGGIFETTEDMPARSYVTFYIQVDDLQVALDKLSGMGGATVVPPMEIAPGMGSIAMFTDLAHNTIGLYSLPAEWDGEMPPKGSAPPVVHFELGGSDAAALEDFYTQMFGWQVNAVDMEGGMTYRLVEQEPDGIGGGIFQHVEGMPPNAPSVAVMVDDLQAYLDKAVSLGATALMQPSEIPGGFGSLAVFDDIAGNRITLFKSPENHT
jgi:predicted enzyme related to lactoylglutathione lyase